MQGVFLVMIVVALMQSCVVGRQQMQNDSFTQNASLVHGS